MSEVISFPNRGLSVSSINGNISFIAIVNKHEIECTITKETLSNLSNTLSDKIIFENNIDLFHEIAEKKINKCNEDKIIILSSDII